MCFVERDYKSEWLTTESVFGFSVIIVILNSAFISLLSLTIFLNKYVKVKNSAIWNSLTWLLFPMIWIGYLLFKHLHYILNYSKSFDSESVFILSNTLPFIIGLSFTFINYRHNKKTRINKFDNRNMNFTQK